MAGRVALCFSFALVVMAGLAGCSGGGVHSIPVPQPTPTSVIFLEAPPSSLAVNAKVTIDAATTFSSAVPANENTGVSYAVSCGSANACGTLSTSDEVGAIVYTAPAAIPSGGTVTVTATSIVDSSLARSMTITIVPPIPIAVSFFATAPASLAVSATFQFNALITNDVSANPEVTWTVTCGGTACGSFNPTTTGSEVQTTYTAPAVVPPGKTVTVTATSVTATSVTDTTKSASTSIVITPQAPTLADGTYVFQWSAPGADEPTLITGVLTAQGGKITGGEQDAIFDNGDQDNEGIYSSFQQFSAGTYATTPDGNVAITIQLGPGDTETLEGTLASGQKGFIGGIDGVPGNGTLEMQTATTAPTGGYAFSLDAVDNYDGSPWIDGIVNVDSAGGISGNGSILDVNAEGNYYGGTQAIGASTVSAPDAYGRVLFQLNPASTATLPVLYVAGYVVDAAHIRLIDVGVAAQSNVVIGAMGGVALGQGANTGTFSAASVVGTNYVLGAQGEDQEGTLQLAGVVSFNAGGKVTGTLSWNDQGGSSPAAPIAVTGSYTVDPTGRVSVTNLTDSNTLTYALHFYMDGDGGGLVLSDDDDDVFAGRAFEQQAGTFSAGSFSGNYGLNASASYTASDGAPVLASAVGSLVATPGSGSDAVAGYADLGASLADFALSGSFTPATDGIFTGTLSGLGAASGSSSPFALYLVDSTQGVAIEMGGAQLTLGRVAVVQP